MPIDKAKPFVKWVGGKRSVMQSLLANVPSEINDYYEPFVGGGALFFEVQHLAKKCYLSDLNPDLIVAYKTIQTKPEQLIERLTYHQSQHSEVYYRKIRALQSLKDPLDNSARFIYLMKTCYNGLYRVNNKGEFNTPVGNYKNPTICDADNIHAVSRRLQSVTIELGRFECIKPKKGDFVYFDPPYHPTCQESFVKYVNQGFTEKDQEKLRDFALELYKQGVNVLISNSDTEYIRSLYKRPFNIVVISAPRAVNCKADKRQKVNEVLIRGY